MYSKNSKIFVASKNVILKIKFPNTPFRTLFDNMAESSMIFVLSTIFSCFFVVTSNAKDHTLSNNELAAKEEMDKPEYQHVRSSHKHYQQLKDDIMEMRKRCGSLCEYKRVPDPVNDTISHDKGYHHVFEKLPVVCESLWNTSIFEQPSPFQDPLQIVPKYLQDYYSYYGGIKVTPHYYADLDTENHVTNAWCM